MKKILCGAEMDRMPNFSFRVMAFIFKIADVFKSPTRRLDPFNIQKGQTVIDYGSGTGRYIKQASELVGTSGTIYPVDLQPLAIESAYRQIEKPSASHHKLPMSFMHWICFIWLKTQVLS